MNIPANPPIDILSPELFVNGIPRDLLASSATTAPSSGSTSPRTARSPANPRTI